jgi:hypothetical protein
MKRTSAEKTARQELIARAKELQHSAGNGDFAEAMKRDPAFQKLKDKLLREWAK